MHGREVQADQVDDVVVFNAVSKHYGTRRCGAVTVQIPDLRIHRGAFVVVSGPSGAGKSTLLALTAGMIKPSNGRIIVGGIDVALLDAAMRAELRRTRIGFVFQQPTLLPHLSARQNVEVALLIAGWDVDTAHECADRTLAALGLAQRADARPGQLSLGQQQRIAIARAIAKGPEILLADEPTSALDDENASIVSELLQTARAQGATVMVTSHRNIFDRVATHQVHLQADAAVAAHGTI